MFNTDTRTTNSIRNSLTGVFCQLFTMLVSFIYRVLFLKVLNETYLGLDGLFTNILGVLSLAELGFGSAIAYRLYKHIKDNDVERLSALVSFYRKIYLYIALIIFILGMAIMPFLGSFIYDLSSIPNDINLYFVYFLFLIQSVITYLFSYKNILLEGDQKNHILTISNAIMNFVKYACQLVVLFVTRNFVLTTVVAICVILITDIAMSLYVKNKYNEVFKRKCKLDKTTKKQIFKETAALMCHKVGGTIVNSTDNILISSFIGIAILGAYSNYSLIIVGIIGLINKLFYSISASVGNLHVSEKNREEEVFRKLVFLNLLIVSICSILYFVLINPFITLFFGSDLTLSFGVVLALTLTFYVNNSKIINNVYVLNCGLFVRDKFRPLIEAIINLVASIILVNLLGLAGIFLGTIIGSLSTVFWREPYLLYKYEFKSKIKEYWVMHAIAFLLMIFVGGCVYIVCSLLPNNFGMFIVKVLISLAITIGMYAVCLCRTSYFKYFKQQAKKILKIIFKKEKVK